MNFPKSAGPMDTSEEKETAVNPAAAAAYLPLFLLHLLCRLLLVTSAYAALTGSTETMDAANDHLPLRPFGYRYLPDLHSPLLHFLRFWFEEALKIFD
jgi:hypothetical protein